MLNAVAQGECMYWGYWQTIDKWNPVMDLLQKPENAGARLCVEAHFPIDSPTVYERHLQLQKLKMASEGRLKIVETTRVREPLEFYLSYFKWSIVGHQLSGDPGYNKSFLEWNPPNLQCNLLMYPTRSDPVERGDALDLLATFGSSDFDQAVDMLDGFDLVGLTNRFAEFAAMAAQLTGISPHYRHEVPDQRYLPAGHERVTDAEVCPDMEACREHVQRLAPWDYKLWSKYSGKFNEMVGEGGEAFKARVEALEADSSASDEGWVGGPPLPSKCAWSDGMPVVGSIGAETGGECQVVPPAVADVVKIDLFGPERAYRKVFGGPKASMLQSQLLDLRVAVSADGKSRKWEPIRSQKPQQIHVSQISSDLPAADTLNGYEADTSSIATSDVWYADAGFTFARAAAKRAAAKRASS
jgi:hypothetical protein